MRVEQPAGRAQQGQWEEATYAAKRFACSMLLAGKRALAEVIPAILDSDLSGAEPKFVSSQAWVQKRGPAKVKTCESIRGIALDRLPHHPIVETQPLACVVRTLDPEECLAALVQ